MGSPQIMGIHHYSQTGSINIISSLLFRGSSFWIFIKKKYFWELERNSENWLERRSIFTGKTPRCLFCRSNFEDSKKAFRSFATFHPYNSTKSKPLPTHRNLTGVVVSDQNRSKWLMWFGDKLNLHVAFVRYLLTDI